MTEALHTDGSGLPTTQLRQPAFSPPYEADGVTVITASATRRHRASRRPAGTGKQPDSNAEIAGGRPIGALVIRNGDVRWRPALDVNRLLVTAQIVVGAVLVADRLTRRPGGARAHVTMGPGGWVSMKGGSMAVRPAERGWRRPRTAASIPAAPPRPLWATLLSAKSLQSLLRS
jgi:hypothetical protein